MAIPRIGQEVIVSYVDGDCDQPIITGRTYPATHPTPYELPRHKTRMTIKSQTHKGKGFNELRFEDEAGQEEIYVHAQKDQTIHVNHDETIAIGHDRTESVGNDEQVTIGKDRRHSIGQDAFLSIERNHAVSIGKDKTETVGNHRKDQTTANHLIDVGGHVEQTVQGHHKLSAGQSIERQTQRYQLEASDRAVIRGPAGVGRS